MSIYGVVHGGVAYTQMKIRCEYCGSNLLFLDTHKLCHKVACYEVIADINREAAGKKTVITITRE